jgi:hypothetical protein
MGCHTGQIGRLSAIVAWALLLSFVVASFGSPVYAAQPVACGNRVYDKETAFAFELTRVDAGEKDGRRYVQYQAHLQANLAWRGNVAYTWLRALGVNPKGKVAIGIDDSRLKVDRVVHKPYYAHFRITVKPGSVLTYKGYLRLGVPITVPSGQITGWNYSGVCTAR